MKKICLSRITLLCAVVLLIGLVGCAKVQTQEDNTESAQTQQTMEGEEKEQPVETESMPEEEVTVRIGSMKGPTSMGLVYLMHQAGKGETVNQYEFKMETAADTLLPMMIKKELDIALLPANVAAILYQKAEGEVSVVSINTLGTLYVVSADQTVNSIEDLKGKTLYLTGKGTTPDYVIRYLLTQSGLSETDVKLEYKSEATEVAVLLAQNPESLGLLPQPFATAACLKNTDLQEVIDITAAWDEAASDGSRLVTGVTVVRKEFLETYPHVVKQFIEEHKESAEYANTETEDAADMVVDFGIMEQAEAAKIAMPKCNITCLAGEEMQEALSGYLSVLYHFNKEAVGGSLPAEDFYWQAQ